MRSCAVVRSCADLARRLAGRARSLAGCARGPGSAVSLVARSVLLVARAVAHRNARAVAQDYSKRNLLRHFEEFLKRDWARVAKSSCELIAAERTPYVHQKVRHLILPPDIAAAELERMFEIQIRENIAHTSKVIFDVNPYP